MNKRELIQKIQTQTKLIAKQKTDFDKGIKISDELTTELKYQRDILVIFYDHIIEMFDNWDKQPEEERVFLLRKNVHLLIEFMNNIIVEKFDKTIELDKKHYNGFMEKWIGTLKDAQKEMKEEFDEKEQAKQKSQTYYS